MTVTPIRTPLAVETADLDVVVFDGYKDVHKGIRSELFGVTVAAGNVDPGDREALAAHNERLRTLVRMLVSHAEHEDTFVQPAIEIHAPELSEIISRDHPALEAQMAALEVLSDRAVDAAPNRRRIITHRLYLGLASFTAEYLQHQAFEELEVTPALSRAMSVDELIGINQAIVASLTPEEMTIGFSVMLPAMNLEDRPEVFAGVWQLVRSVLEPADFAALATRLEVAA
jgi:hypothetical protein